MDTWGDPTSNYSCYSDPCRSNACQLASLFIFSFFQTYCIFSMNFYELHEIIITYIFLFFFLCFFLKWTFYVLIRPDSERRSFWTWKPSPWRQGHPPEILGFPQWKYSQLEAPKNEGFLGLKNMVSFLITWWFSSCFAGFDEVCSFMIL